MFPSVHMFSGAQCFTSSRYLKVPTALKGVKGFKCFDDLQSTKIQAHGFKADVQVMAARLDLHGLPLYAMPA